MSEESPPQLDETTAAPPAKDYAWIVAKHVFVMLIFGALLWYQSAKVHRMENTYRVLSTLPASEIDVTNVKITRKWDSLQNGTDHDTVDIAMESSPRDYWVSWEESGEWATTDRRMEISKVKWDTLQVGSSLEIIRVKGDRTPYLRSEIASELSGAKTERVLLWAWRIGVALTLLSLLLSLFVDWSFLSDDAEKPKTEPSDNAT